MKETHPPDNLSNPCNAFLFASPLNSFLVHEIGNCLFFPHTHIRNEIYA